MLWIGTGLLALYLAACSACGGGSGQTQGLGKNPVALVGITQEGIVKEVNGKSRMDEELPEDKGGLIFDVQHVDRLVNQQVLLEIFPAGDSVASLGKVVGNDRKQVDPGTYDALLVYSHSDVARYEGWIRNLEVHQGRTSKCEVKIEAPVGMLDLRFLNDGVDINAKVKYSVYPAATEEDPVRGDPMLADQSPLEQLALPTGSYDILAVYHETDAVHQDAWVEGLEIKGGMARTVHTYDFSVTLHGFILTVKNFEEDVSDRSTVYFYYPGANVEFAVAVDQGAAGERLVVKPGEYDVRVVFQPSSEQSTWGDKVLKGIKIGVEDEAEDAEAGGEGAEVEDGEGGEATEPDPAAEGDEAADEGEAAEGEAAEGDGEAGLPPRPKSQLIEMEIDMEIPLATLVIKVLYGGEDVSDKSSLRVINAGADKSAASAVLSITGLSEHIVPAGEYDINISFEEADLSGSRWFEGIVLGHGDSWTQELDLHKAK